MTILTYAMPALRTLLCGFPLAVAMTGAVAAVEETIELEGGKRVVGDVIKETDEAVFVDLGYTIVEIPVDEIDTRTLKLTQPGANEAAPAGAGADASAGSGERVYTIGRLEPVAVRDAVKRFGEGVVRVNCAGGQGSGFVIDKRGYVVTNYHVVENERDVEIVIYQQGDGGLEKKNLKNIEIVAINEFLDLALLRIPEAEKYPLKPLVLADPASIKPGEAVFAIGAPLGLERTITEGIISDAQRSFEGNCYIQTDVAINPGNSGGPLFNSRGEVIGVTNMGYRGMEGLNFAIPVDIVSYFLDRRAAFLFDESRPNTGVHYFDPPRKSRPSQ